MINKVSGKRAFAVSGQTNNSVNDGAFCFNSGYSLLITTLAETPLVIAYVFRINIPHLNIAAGIGIVFFLIFLWSGK